MDYETFKILKFAYDKADTTPANDADIHRANAAHAIINGTVQRMLATEGFDSEVTNLLPRMAEAATKHFQDCLQPGHAVQPILPILSENIATEYVTRIKSLAGEGTEYDRRQLAAQALAAYMYELKDVWLTNPSLRFPQLPPNIMVEFDSYSAWRFGEESTKANTDIFGFRSIGEYQKNNFREEIDGLVGEQQDRIGTLSSVVDQSQKHLEDAVQRLNIEGDKVQKKIDGMNELLEKSRLELQEILNSTAATKSNLAAFKRSMELQYGTKATKRLWKYRGNWSAVSFWLSAFVVAVSIVGPPWYALTHISVVVDVLKQIGDAATIGIDGNGTPAQVTAAAVSRLVIVSAPLALYFWGVKLLVRFNARSMILMDDARQRHTTMDTYIHLVDKDKATLEERALMLTALFRPLPGQAPENVEPPNFVDIIGKKGD